MRAWLVVIVNFLNTPVLDFLESTFILLSPFNQQQFAVIISICYLFSDKCDSSINEVYICPMIDSIL